MTLSDLEQLSGCHYALFHTKWQLFGANCVKLTEDPYCQRRKCSPGIFFLVINGLWGTTNAIPAAAELLVLLLMISNLLCTRLIFVYTLWTGRREHENCTQA